MGLRSRFGAVQDHHRNETVWLALNAERAAFAMMRGKSNA